MSVTDAVPGGARRTRCLNEALVVLECEQRIGKISKELFQEAGNAVGIVKEAFRISEVDVGAI